jgi:uncharacterized membrane protein
MNEEKTTKEEFRVSGDEVVAKIKELFAAGNVRRIILKNDSGATIFEVPVTVAVIGVLLVPVLAAVGAVAALTNHCTIVVEKKE